MNIDPQLLSIIVCPACHGELRRDGAEELVCQGVATPTPCATTSRCCWSTRPASPPED